MFFQICVQVMALCVASSVGRIFSSDRIYYETDFPREYENQPSPSSHVQISNSLPAFPAALPLSSAPLPAAPQLSVRGQIAEPTQQPQVNLTAPQQSTFPGQSPHFHQIADAVNGLALRMQDLLDVGSDTLAFSPLSVVAALSMVLLGSGGKTYAGLSNLMGVQGEDFSNNTDLIHQELSDYFKRIETPMGNGTIKFANGVFLDEGYHATLKYMKDLKQFYGEEVVPVNFHKRAGNYQMMSNGLDAKDLINSWFKNRTGGHMDQIISNPLPIDTIGLFINVIYLSAAWKVPFCSRYTKNTTFYVSPTETMQVPMMFGISKAYYNSDEARGFTVLGLPYQNSDITMFFILPTKGPREFLKGLQVKDIYDIIDNTTYVETTHTIPRMKLKRNLKLKDTLSHLGLSDMFSETKDLKGFADGVVVGDVRQTVEVVITETGTIASASTMVSVTRGGYRPLVRLTKPFIFFIYHKSLKTISFWGTVYKPVPYTDNPSKC